MRTTCRLDRDRHGAGRAVPRNWRGSRRRPLQLVHRFDYEKNADGDDDKVDHESDKISVVPSHCPCLGRLGRSIKGTTAGRRLKDEEFVGEIEATGKYAYRRHENVFDE